MFRTELEEQARLFLETKNLFPFSILYSCSFDFIKISFYLDNDIKEFLDLMDYKNLCDKSGYTCIPETKTILLNGMAVEKFIRLWKI